MREKMINRTRIEGLLYEHDLKMKETGPNSKVPGTKYITGTISVATDDAGKNVIPVYFRYVAPTFPAKKPGEAPKENANFNILSNIIKGITKNVMDHGAEDAAKLRIDSAIALNEFYTNRNGKEELVVAKRNEGGFIHVEQNFTQEDENARNTFEVDMIITSLKVLEATDTDPEKARVGGYIFNFRKELLPVEFTAINPKIIGYYEQAEVSERTPVFMKIKGNMVSITQTRTVVEENVFGDDIVKEVPGRTYKDFIIDSGANPYEWDDESTITGAEVKKLLAEREIHLAEVRQNRENFLKEQAAKTAAPEAPSAANGYGFWE